MSRTSIAASLWQGAEPLLLASGSASRRVLLEQAGIPVETQAPDLDERAVEAPLAASGATPAAIALALAKAKAVAVSLLRPGRVVLGGDQTLSLGDRAFHKPPTLAAAHRQIAALAGTTHRLASAGALVRDGAVLWEALDTACLTMRPLSEPFIAAYVAAAGSGVCDSVGGYKLEGLGIHLFERIEGDHATILGLPLLPLLGGLRGLGLLVG